MNHLKVLYLKCLIFSRVFYSFNQYLYDAYDIPSTLCESPFIFLSDKKNKQINPVIYLALYHIEFWIVQANLCLE